MGSRFREAGHADQDDASARPELWLTCHRPDLRSALSLNYFRLTGGWGGRYTHGAVRAFAACKNGSLRAKLLAGIIPHSHFKNDRLKPATAWLKANARPLNDDDPPVRGLRFTVFDNPPKNQSTDVAE